MLLRQLEKSSTYNTRSKQLLTKLPHWVDTTETTNYIVKDTLIDFLKLKYKKKPEQKCTQTFDEYISEISTTFKNNILQYIKTKCIVQSVSNTINNNTVSKTIELMKEGTLIIHSAPIRNYKNITQGIVDFLVRSDYINQLFEQTLISDTEMSIQSPNLQLPFHYVVVHVTYSTVPLKSDGVHILNTGMFLAYKSHCLLHTESIGLIQGYQSPYALVIGRRVKYTKNNIKYTTDHSFKKIGIINYSTIDKQYIKLNKKALQWHRRVTANVEKWKLNPPTVKELYPNMCIQSGTYQSDKKKIADDINDITSVWRCGIKQRDIAFKNGIKSWEKCTIQDLGIEGKSSSIIDAILKINQQNELKISPTKIISDLYNWREPKNEMFLDIELLTDIFLKSDSDNLLYQPHDEFIFMIGVYWKNNTNWEYKKFIASDLSNDEQFRIMTDFDTFISDHHHPSLWFWNADDVFMKRGISKLQKLNYSFVFNEYTWNDLSKLFKQEPIVIKNCFNFSLKNIAASLLQHHFITTKLTSECTSGSDAMMLAYEYYKNPSHHLHILNDIETYNTFDCQVLYDILFFLRQHL